MAFQSRAQGNCSSLLDGKLQEFRNAGRAQEKGRDQRESVKLAAYSISKWPIAAPGVVSSAGKPHRRGREGRRTPACPCPYFSLIFYFAPARKLAASKVHPPSRLLPVVFLPPPVRRGGRGELPAWRARCSRKKKQKKKNARSTLGRGGEFPEKQMRGDQSAPRAHRTRD